MYCFEYFNVHELSPGHTYAYFVWLETFINHHLVHDIAKETVY